MVLSGYTCINVTFIFQRIVHNLHVVLCFTPLSPELTEVCKRFPGLVTHATVDVFDEWPAKALYSVAVKEMQADEILQSTSGSLLKVMNAFSWVPSEICE